MTEFIEQYNLAGLLIGACTFLIIGLFHPLVIKGEYYIGVKVKWIFLVAGIIFLAAALWVRSVIGSSLLGVTAFSCFWSIKEVNEQVERVRKGWFPPHPENLEMKDCSELLPTGSLPFTCSTMPIAPFTITSTITAL